jgi:beta-phosphoglucomutase
MNKFKCIVFDLDGTLIDTTALLFNAYKEFLKKYDCTGTKKEFELLNGPKLDEIIIYLKKKYTLKPSKLKLKRQYDEQIKKIYQTKVDLNDGIVHLLDFLKLNGYVIGLATSNSKKNTTSVLIKNNLLDYFSFLVYGDDVGIAKPDPAIYKICIKRSGFKKNQILVIEDSKNGFNSAKNAGLVCKKTIKFKLLENWLSKNNISPKYEIIKSKSCVVTVKPSKNKISSNIQKKINQTWNKLQKDRIVKLSNHKVLILNSMTVKKGINYISSEFTDYKNVISSRINPKLDLNLIQIGTSGIILFKNNNSVYTIFSKRNKNTTEYPNYYELIPSGNINQKLITNKKLKFELDLINEFVEETGLNSKYIKKISFLCIIKDKKNCVTDICSIIELNLNKKFILRNFKSSEYSKPLFVPISLLPKFIERNQNKIVPTSIGILDSILEKNI